MVVFRKIIRKSGSWGDCGKQGGHLITIQSPFLHWELSDLESWSQSSQIKSSLGITECLSYLQQAELPAGKCTPGRGRSTQPEVRRPTSPQPWGTELYAEDRELPGDLKFNQSLIFQHVGLEICCYCLCHLVSFFELTICPGLPPYPILETPFI
jgi:hypothetical protein